MSGLATAGLAAGSTAVSADPEVTTEVVAPKGGIRGLGHSGEWFFSVHPNDAHDTGEPYWYYFDESGDIDSSGGFGDLDSGATARYGCAVGDEASYISKSNNIEEFADSGEVVEHDAPAEVQSLAYDDDGGQLWGGGENGRVWEFDDQITVEQSLAFSGSVFGLAHDGEYLWVATTDSNIMQVDPGSGDIEESYDYPVSVTIYDLAFLDDRLWLAGDGRVYGTNISASMATETPTPTATRTSTRDSSPRRIDESEVTSEVVAPKAGIRGLGWYENFYTVHPSDVHDTGEPYWYLFDENGSIDSSGGFGDEGSSGRYGLAVGEEGTYISRYDEIVEYTRTDPITHSAPAEVQSLTYDDDGGQLWGSGTNGRVWQFDDQVTVEQTLSFSGSVFGLAHDGEHLWVTTSDSSHIRRVDPATGDVDESFEYPVSVTIYGILYQGDRLWLAGDGRLYETNLSATATTESATPEPTPTPATTESGPESGPGPGGEPTETEVLFEPPGSDETDTQTRSPTPTETETPTATKTPTPEPTDPDTEAPGGKTEPREPQTTATAASGPGFGLLAGLAGLGLGAWRSSQSESEPE